MFDPKNLAIIREVGRQNGCDPDAFAAVTFVESAGVPYWEINGRFLPAIRWEGHYFYRRLTGEELSKAIDQGLAAPRAGGIKNSNSWAGRYAMLARARELNNDMALESISMGVGQVMGAWWQDLKYASVEDMWNTCLEGIHGQCEVMVKFLKANNLIAHLNRHDWDHFAEKYNGPAYKRYNYDSEMAKAYRMLVTGGGGEVPVEKNQTRWLQDSLKKLSYDVGIVDGIYGDKTRAALRKFQTHKGLVVDGIAGPMTIDAIRDALESYNRLNGL